MVNKVHLVRHAQSIYTPEERTRGLTDKGKKDAIKVSKVLNNEKIDLIFSSLYKRAIETIKPFSDLQKKEIKIIEDFRERTISNKPIKNFDYVMNCLWGNFHYSLPDGESNNAAQKRGVETLINCLNLYKNKNFIISTHGNLLVLILNYFNKKYDYNFWRSLTMPDIYYLEIENYNLLNIKRVWNS